MLVMKFGGSSLGSPERIQAVLDIIREKAAEPQRLACIVSAMGGVTDALISMAVCAARSDANYLPLLIELQERHFGAARALLPAAASSEACSYMDEQFRELAHILQGVFLIRELSLRTQDLIMSFGERFNAYLISCALKQYIPEALFWDARALIKTDTGFGAARVFLPQSYALLSQRWVERPCLPIITGFIAATEQGETTTLGRGGSDYTAAIVGVALHAEEIEIWTDVDGMMTADPRKVFQAFPIAEMSYKEALEMSHFGAKVIHPPTVLPAMQHSIPLRIKNTFSPQAAGTLVSVAPCRDKDPLPICGISSIDDVALMRLEGGGMVGVCGVAMRLFGALANKQISVILISQGSSEHSICFAIAPSSAQKAKEAIEEAFSLEICAGLIDSIAIEVRLAVIAIVGENMRRTSGIAGKLFGALGRNGINVIAIAQGSSEYNISVVIGKEDETKALNVVHEEFFLSAINTVHLFSG